MRYAEGEEMSKPDWKDAPDWAHHWAMDEDGDCFWYESKPTLGEFSWYDGGEFEEAEDIITNVFWRKSLEHRP